MMTKDKHTQSIADALRKPTNAGLNMSDAEDFSDLDALFSKARGQEPVLADDNFRKIVLNSLPANPPRKQRRSWLFDAVGMILGFFACYFFFDFSAVATATLALIPESFTLTVANLAAMLAAVVAASVLAWWTTEKVIH